MLKSSTIEADPSILPPAEPKPLADERPAFDWRALAANPTFQAAAVLTVALLLAFAGLMRMLPEAWFGPDTLFSHGPLIPLMSAYIIWMRWDKIKDTPVKGSLYGLVLLLPVLYLAYVGSISLMRFELSALFLVACPLVVWTVAGSKWMWKTLPALMYLAFCVPLFWVDIVNRFTLPMQQLSTQMAMKVLTLGGMEPIQADPTTILLNNYPLNVAAPCSGAKLTLALAAFTIFFILIGGGKLWQNIALIAIVLPFTLFINGLRIAMIGVVGNFFGAEAGHQFHDYGGYISLVICFILLKYITRMLGFKS